MSSAVIPQWKVALQQKLDKKKEDERRKLQDEEQRRLDALPPWKRMAMVPKSVIIISGGTKTVSKLPSESQSYDNTEQVESSGKESNNIKSGSAGSSSSSTMYRNENLKNAGNLQHNHVVSTEKNVTNHVGVDEHDGAKEKTIAARDGVDEEHVVSVFDNPFLRHDGGKRKRKVSPVITEKTKGSNSVQKQPELQTVHKDVPPTITKTQPRESVAMTKKEPENSIRQRSRSASPRRAAKANGIDLKFSEAEEVPAEPRARKNSVSDLRNKFGRPASVGDLNRVSHKLSDSDDNSPRSPRSPTPILDRTKLFSSQPQTVHFTGKSASASRLSPTTVPAPAPSKVAAAPAPSKVAVSNSTSTIKQSNSMQDNTSKQSEIKPLNPPQLSKVVAVASSVVKVTPKRQAPKPPTTTDPVPVVSRKTSPTEPKTVSISPTQESHSVEKPESTVSNKPVETANSSSTTNHDEQADQPKTAIVVGDGQSSLRRKRGTGKMSASALISLSTDNNSQDKQLSEHNSRVRAARQEARASSSKNLLRSARDGETKDTESIPSGAVSTNTFGQKKETKENHSPSDSTPKDDIIPYPSNFRQPQKEPTYVDTIPYPSNFRQPKSQTKETTEEKDPPIKLISYTRSVKETIEEVPRTNIDDVTLSPVKETPKLMNGRVEEKLAPRKLKKTPGKEWVGYNTPAGKPSALKSVSKLGCSDSKKLRIAFNDSNLSEVFEYQSESSLLDEYLREERGMNGNPRVGNLPRQEAKVEEDDDIDLGDLSVPSAKTDNVLAHEGLQSFTPKDMQNFSPSSFRQQQQQQRSAPTPKEEEPPPTDEPASDELAITYDDSGDYFSSAGSGSAALLF
ncbi:microtubule-associated protein futsch-like [Asterias rubens]|uniref:microtubule-associated protein futsch-like n=1 Tax=Asterias rubens TaxID=7604 RepID=UPI00145523FE|nr:microtubule-associated protein futsch-like [Asterias rubens]